MRNSSKSTGILDSLTLWTEDESLLNGQRYFIGVQPRKILAWLGSKWCYILIFLACFHSDIPLDVLLLWAWSNMWSNHSWLDRKNRVYCRLKDLVEFRRCRHYLLPRSSPEYQGRSCLLSLTSSITGKSRRLVGRPDCNRRSMSEDVNGVISQWWNFPTSLIIYAKSCNTWCRLWDSIVCSNNSVHVFNSPIDSISSYTLCSSESISNDRPFFINPRLRKTWGASPREIYP